MQSTSVMPLGVVIERRALTNPWQAEGWRPVAVFPGAAEIGDWVELRRGPGWVHYHAATLPLELHRKEVTGYRHNLSNDPALVYVVLRRQASPDSDRAVYPFLITASPYDAEAYIDSGDDIVEGVVMPEAVAMWLMNFIERQPNDPPFIKRKRGSGGGPVAERPPGQFGPLKTRGDGRSG